MVRDLRAGRIWILIATDILARGIDFKVRAPTDPARYCLLLTNSSFTHASFTDSSFTDSLFIRASLSAFAPGMVGREYGA